VILQVNTDIDGNVINIEVLKGVHRELDRAAVEAIKLWKYEPVKKDGKPIPVRFTVTVDFKLRKKRDQRK
jgi:protein TonB